jgi:hypothetical protein
MYTSYSLWIVFDKIIEEKVEKDYLEVPLG